MVKTQVDFDLNLKFLIYEDFSIDYREVVPNDYNEVEVSRDYYWRFSPEDTEDNYDSIERIEDVCLR